MRKLEVFITSEQMKLKIRDSIKYNIIRGEVLKEFWLYIILIIKEIKK